MLTTLYIISDSNEKTFSSFFTAIHTAIKLSNCSHSLSLPVSPSLYLSYTATHKAFDMYKYQMCHFSELYHGNKLPLGFSILLVEKV